MQGAGAPGGAASQDANRVLASDDSGSVVPGSYQAVSDDRDDPRGAAETARESEQLHEVAELARFDIPSPSCTVGMAFGVFTRMEHPRGANADMRIADRAARAPSIESFVLPLAAGPGRRKDGSSCGPNRAGHERVVCAAASAGPRDGAFRPNNRAFERYVDLHRNARN